ncbi:DUF11 domain-containing protein [Cohnella sp. LGH]|uniref:DUF11 domain-containing protein n=1 Tax=Cohnella sp. LGH TaxID=1619153 RepID=UPI001ADC852C|nr:DUF11 domain-containing protein [Cohnella sp. LGH]QTH43200.1 DUF11 domain-containing protein [Cohnella sp. LGH]
MSFVNRFVLNENGALTFTGNTLGLSRSERVGVPGQVDSIGGFIDSGTTGSFGSYPAGTTEFFQSNSSSAVLDIPAGSAILYAELVWGGMYLNNGVNLSPYINRPVTFTTPQGTYSITPDLATANNVLLAVSSNFPDGYAFVRSAEVTDLISAGGSGTYTTGGVVSTLVIPDPTSNHAGWTLAVAYSNPSLPIRNLSLRVGAAVIQAPSGPVDTLITGFATPAATPLNGRVLLSAQEGDANKTGDQALFGRTLASLNVLSGPNNYSKNFFASQINGDSGQLDTRGTFGSRNQINGTPGSNIVGGRQGYDITNVSAAGTLSVNQTSAFLRLTTSGDGYLVNSFGIQIDVDEPIVRIDKSVNRTATTVGDLLTYTLTIVNKGKVTAENPVIFSTPSAGAEFVTGSTTVAGTSRPLESPYLGVSVGDINPGGGVTLTYQVRTVTQPSPPSLSDQGQIAYDFRPTPTSPVLSVSVPSNIVKVPVYLPVINVVKSADRTVTQLGDIVMYTIEVQNTGNIAANVVLTDSIPQGAAFVQNSVTVNTVPRPGESPMTGIALGSIPPGDSTTVAFQIHVITPPPGNVLVNRALTPFTYQLPDQREFDGSAASNEVKIPVTTPTVEVNKSANPLTVLVGETITYTVKVQNLNPNPITQVVLTDPIPTGSIFVPGSVTIDGTPSPDAYPQDGIAIGTIPGSSAVTVAFQLTATTLENPPVLTNQAFVHFKSGSFTGTSVSHEVSVSVYTGKVTIAKSADPLIVRIGDIINYTVFLQNSGNLPITAIVTDSLSRYVMYVGDSVSINGISVPGVSPQTGIPVGVLQPNELAIVAFEAVLTTAPPDQLILNRSIASFSFVLPDGRSFTDQAVSNTVVTQDPITEIQVTKTPSETVAVVGDVITYQVELVNTSGNVLENVTFRDTTTEGSQFVSGSVKINGVSVPDANPDSGFEIGELEANSRTTVTYDQKVLFAPQSTVVKDRAAVAFTIQGEGFSGFSNEVAVQIMEPVITATKRAVQEEVVVGEVIHYVIDVTNKGDINVEVTVEEPQPENTVFAENSALLNISPVPGQSPVAGIGIGTVGPGETKQVVFHVRVVSVPADGIVKNRAAARFSYSLPDGRAFNGTALTNETRVRVAAPPVIRKTSDKTEVTVGENLGFFIAISNNTPLVFDNAVLRDEAPVGLEWIANSVAVNGLSRSTDNPDKGISLGTISPGQNVQVSFRATAAFEPPREIAENTATLEFEYVLPNGRRTGGVARSNPLTIVIMEEEE